ncbi:synaptotagmin-like protein 4 isoform X1 [Topomyia yanbarensis]|uniref:synaptotagmin-like protein 4 isoform X1 n=1 Tax=Topomyia yanbarensis TaxID=2498891 RepID=UPI00273ACE1B|nr:synaptotagmin-like protein 4 isoform X1 [Topomyia yanbarensis]
MNFKKFKKSISSTKSKRTKKVVQENRYTSFGNSDENLSKSSSSSATQKVVLQRSSNHHLSEQQMVSISAVQHYHKSNSSKQKQHVAKKKETKVELKMSELESTETVTHKHTGDDRSNKRNRLRRAVARNWKRVRKVFRTVFCCQSSTSCGKKCFDYVRKNNSLASTDEDDIDAAFEGYKKQLLIARGGNNTTGILEVASTVSYDELTPSQQSTIKKLHKNKFWNWNDSVKSKSDKFLECLEMDDISCGDASLRKKFTTIARRKQITAFCENRAILGEIELEEGSVTEPSSSPLFGAPGNRNDTTGGSNQELSKANITATGAPAGAQRSSATSPIGSATSEHWPSQSDEDIDRLVAMHQNRASLSSLGVRSDSMASVYSGAGEGRYGTVTVRGQIEFGMQYNYKQGALEIHVKQCKDLAAVDAKRNRSDPYVKVYLLPDKSKGGKRKTKVKKHTLNPVFDEVLRFHMSLSGLQTRTLWITVWHSDMFGRNDFLGEVMMGLQDKVFENPAPQSYQLQERSEPFDDLSAYKGDIIVGLKYIPPDSDGGTPQHHQHNGGSSTSGGGTLNLRKFSTKSITSTSSNSSGQSKGALHVLVKEAKNLQPVKANGTCDAFCKSYLLPDKNRSSKQKTPVMKRSNSPVWNYTFIYEDVALSELSERALELTLWDHDRLASNEFLGGVRFSLGTGKHAGKSVDWMDSTGKELSLWQSMINRPNFWVEGALVLRPSLDNAKFAS